MNRHLALLITLVFIWLPVNAADIPFEFEAQEQEQRYKDLIEELRCLVCQNQSLADSNADLAQDLRQEVYLMIIDGKGNDEIVDFLIKRYGDFVMYRPPVNTMTYFLWFGPFILLIAAVFLIILVGRNRKKSASVPMSADEQRRLAEILNQQSTGKSDR